MSVARFQIVKVFADPSYLFFEHGVIWSGDPMNGTIVLYRKNGHCQEIVTNRNGEIEGLRATYHPLGTPRSFRHYSHGKLYGEAISYDRTGLCIEHLLYTGKGDDTVDYRPDLANDYPGYCICQDDLDAERKFRAMGPRGWVDE
jgi:hypothetical protein